jgi:hypothetical protein
MNHWTLRSTVVFLGLSLSIATTAATTPLVCAPKIERDQLVLNELITTGNNNKYTEVKVRQDQVDITPYELCLGALPLDNNGLKCKPLGTGEGKWEQTVPLKDNKGPDSSAPTTFNNPTWITYDNQAILGRQMKSATGQLFLRNMTTNNIVDYLCYSEGYQCRDPSTPFFVSPARLPTDPIDPAAPIGPIDPTDTSSVCWSEIVNFGNSSDKLFARTEPDGDGVFTAIDSKTPSTGATNDGPGDPGDQEAAICAAIDADTFVPVYGGKSLEFLANSELTVTNKIPTTGTYMAGTTDRAFSVGYSINKSAFLVSGQYFKPLPNFPVFSGGTNATTSSTNTLGAGSYQTVTANDGGNFSPTTPAAPYTITNLTVASNATVTFGKGTYYVGTLTIGSGATVATSGGIVNFIIGTKATIGAGALINPTRDPAFFALTAVGASTLETSANSGTATTSIKGTIITDSNTVSTFRNGLSIQGSVFGKGRVIWGGKSIVNYSAAAINAQRLRFGCGGTTPSSGATVVVTPSTPTSAITCQPQPVTLNVTKADGTPYVGTLKLTTSTIKGNWQPSANLIDATPNDGIATVSFVATDLGKKDLQLSHTLSGTVSVTATDTVTSTITATSVPITFSDAGLLWLDSAGAVIAPVSNPLVLVAGTPQPVQLRAVKQGTTPGVCTGVFANGEKPPLLIGSTCVDPASCAVGQQLQGVGVNNVSFVIGNPQNTLSTTNEITFGANSTATISLMSPDVGKMDLSATFAGNATSPALLGATSGGAIISKPATLKITNVRTAASTPVTNPAASTAAGSVFARAGERFFADVTSYNSLGIVTPSFGRESTTPQPSLAAAAVAPMGGIAGLITKTGSWVKGAVGSGSVVFDTTAGLTYSEVGAISLAPGLLDYLGAGAVPTTTTTTIGRFIPDRLEVSASAGVLSTTCPVIYRGQPLAYSTSPTLTVTAVNKAGNVTRNYDDGFFKLPATMPVGAYTLNQTTSGSLWGLPLTTMAAWAPVSGNTGAATLQFNNFLLSRVGDPTSSDAPIDDGITVQLPDTGNSIIKDTDGVCVINIVTGLCSSIAWELPSTNLQWLYGRISMTNNNGAETEALNMPVTAEYWDGLNWQTNLLENGTCTALLNSDFSPGQWTAATGTPDTSVTNWTGFGLGTGSYDLTAPGAGNTGKITMTGNVPSWLKAWDGTAFTLDPSATAVFGIYRGRPPILFRTR